MKIKQFSQLNDYVNNGRKKKNIIAVGKYSNLPKDELVYVFIHNRQGEVVACLKKEMGNMLNLATKKTDVISNYKGCGAIWIKFSN